MTGAAQKLVYPQAGPARHFLAAQKIQGCTSVGTVSSLYLQKYPQVPVLG